MSRTGKLLLGVALLAALFRLPGLGYPGEEYFDEVYHAKTARQYLNGEPPTEWVHPPTAKLLIAAGVALFGYEPWAWRLVPALAGILIAPVFLLLALRVLASERAALFATLLLLMDGVYLVQSRIAMTNVFAVLFQLTSVLLLLRAVAEEELRTSDMAALGLALGLALSTRWTSLFAWGFMGLVYLVVRRARAFRARDLALGALSFVVLPAAVYLLSYVPWMAQTHPSGLAAWWQRVLAAIAWQKDIWGYHAHLDATHTYFSRWWTWPFLYRPTWYFWFSGGDFVRGIVALGNPAIWWASLPVSVWALVVGIRWRDPRLVFCGAGYFLLYLPWGLSPRTLNFSHYLLEAIPYACLSLGALLDRRWNQGQAFLARGYLVAVAALFVLFLPFLTAMPVPNALWSFRFPGLPVEIGPYHVMLGGFGIWTWFPTWI